MLLAHIKEIQKQNYIAIGKNVSVETSSNRYANKVENTRVPLERINILLIYVCALYGLKYFFFLVSFCFY